MELLLKNETGEILDAAVEVHRLLGFGLLEKLYENALAREFALRGIPYSQQPRFPVEYKGCHVGEFIPDLIAFGQVIVDTKTIQHIGDIEVGQMLNYLRITGLKVGMIINFKHAKIEVRRVII